VQWLSSEIKLRYDAALGTTIYLTECLQSWAQKNITGWNLKPNNRLQSDPIGWKGLGHLGWSCDFGQKVWMRGAWQETG